MTRRTRIRTLTLVAVALLAALSLVGASISASSTPRFSPAVALEPDAPPPSPRISYQGRLVDPATGEPKPDGRYDAIFELYSVDVGGTPLWGEKQQIVTSKGLFTVLLGNDPLNPIDPAIFDGYGRWLSVSIDPDGELLPRVRVAHAPYAIYATLAGTAANAANADRLGGQPPANYAPASHTHDAAAITTGTLAYGLFSAYGDLANDARIGAAAGMVAAGLHTHTGTDIVDGSIGALDLADGSVTSAKIADGNVANADLAANSVDSAKIVDGGVGTADLAANSVTSAKIADGTVGSADLADGSVNSAKIADGTVANADLAASSVTTAKIADGSVTAAKLSSGLAPIAYGFILSSGVKNWGTSNVTSSWDATNSWYAITISGYSYFYSDYITVVTPICGPGWSVSTGSVSGNLLVNIANASNVKAQCNFQFVTYH